MAKVMVPLADGVEEMEAVIVIDVFRRAGWTVESVGMKPGPITASRGVRLIPDMTWHEIDPSVFDLLVIPGGSSGTDHLAGDQRVLEVIRRFVQNERWVGAICAGTLVLQSAGVLEGRKVTCHPAVASQLTVTQRVDERVVVDGKIVTSQGPGTAFEFALALLGLIEGEKVVAKVEKGLVLKM